MIIDGKEIAADILREVAEGIRALQRPVRLGVLYITPDFATQKFISIKEKRAEELGVEVVKRELPEGIGTEGAVRAMVELCALVDGVVVQVPLAEGIDAQTLIEAVPASKDVDAIAKDRLMLSPVISALEAIVLRYGVDPRGKQAVVIGKGRLVGEPAARWLQSLGAVVVVLEKGDALAAETVEADIIVLGAGQPGLLTPDMVKEGVVVLDAGTSESSGKLAGDADPRVADKAALFTPVPGGVGPIAVAMLFKNLLQLAQRA